VRGLDIPAVSHIFNYDVPYHPDDYVHRIGRTGRAGRSGHAYMLVTPRDGKYLEAIERLIGNKLETRALEGLQEAADSRPPREDRGGRDRNKGGRGRGDRDRKREYPVKPHGQVASMAPAQPVAAPVEPVPQQPVQLLQQPRRDQRQDHRQKPQQQQQPQKPRAPKPEPVEDLRSQLPAFLLRPVPLPKAPEKPAPRTKSKAVTES
jgi:superfamily II DNA/RNA helicase